MSKVNAKIPIFGKINVHYSMKNVSPLFSQYILEGVQMEETPFSALYDCLDGNGSVDRPQGPFQDIIDEYLDKTPISESFDETLTENYCQKILRTAYEKKRVNLDFPVSWTIARISGVLLEAMFRNGHFTLGDLMLIAKWDWNNSPAGNLAAFYDSTITAGHYLYDLGLKLDRYFVEENAKGCFMDISICSDISSRRKCPDKALTNCHDSKIIYIPFCQTKFNLGGSALSELCGSGSGVEPDLNDPDYFIDCYEVVRELVEDGIIIAGTVVGRGGLVTAAEKFCGKQNLPLDLSGIMSATGETDMIRLMFAEIPGVMVQIKETDMDYVDSQFVLQEIAYYPVGKRSSISSILSSLLLRAENEENQ